MDSINRYKYNFDDFTLKEYEELILLAKSKYEFVNYTTFDISNNFVLWRHDVDFSIHSALELAKIESKHNVSSTYFLLFHSEFYNLFEKEITEKVYEIIKMGHNIGLHFDASYYNLSSEKELSEFLSFEKNMLENLFKVPVNVFSFHNPFDFALSCQEFQYAGIINTYAKIFQAEIGYCSDSNGYWRYNRLKDVLLSEQNQNLQVLTHPEWWQKEVLSPFDKVKRCLDGRRKNNIESYISLLEKNNRKIIDWQ